MADTEALRLLLLQQLQASSGTPRSPATNAAAAAQVQLDNNFINSSDFRIFCFKILPCTRRYGHDWTACPFCHPGEKATRRCPQKHSYMPLACPDIKKTGECPRRDACTYAHNVFEFWCHPLRFRTQLCSYGADCKRSICFFAHSYSELRVVDQSLLQELERQMDLLGEGAGFGFPPASKRSARDERYGPLAPGDVFALPSATGNTPRRSGEDTTMSLTSQSSGRITTAMSEARAVADRAMPTVLLPDGSTPQMGDHHSGTSSPFVSVEGMTVDSVSGEGGLQSSGGGSASNGPGSGAGGPGADTGPSSCGALSGMEPSMAALQMLQMQAAQQRQQQHANQQRAGAGSYNHDKIQAAAALLGLDASYLGQVLQAAPPPPPPVTVANGVQVAMQNLMQQLLAANGGGGSVPASPAANPPSLGGWVGDRGAAEAAQSRAMAMLMGMAEGGGGAGNGSLRVPMEPIHAVPSLRANEEQMASTIKVLMELNAGSRGMGTPTVPTPRGGNGGGGGNNNTMHAAMQQLQELGSLRPQLVQQLQELGSLAVANGSGASNGNTSMHSVVQQLQEQLGSLRAPLPEPEPAGGLAAALASMQHSIDTARLQQALGSITQHNGGGNMGDNNGNNGNNANAALVSALLSQLSGNHGGTMNSPHRPHQQQHHPQQHQQQQQLQQQLSGGINLSDMGLSAFNGASAAAIAAAAAAQAAGTSLTVAPQPQDRHAYANAAHHALNASNSNHHQFNVPQGHNGATNQHHANGAGAGATNGHGGAKGASSPSPVDVLSMRSQRSGPPGSGSDSLAGSDGSGSPPPSNANANTRTVEMSESVEEEDLAAHPELLGAHRLLGTLSELVGGGGAGTNGCAGSPMAVPSNAAAAAAAASNHPLRGSPSLRAGAVSFSPPGNTLLGASMSTPLLGLENLRLNGSFTATGQQRPSFESRMFGGLGMGAVGSTGGLNAGGAGGLNLVDEGAGMGLGMSLGGLDMGGGANNAAAGLNLGGVAVSGGSGTGLGVIGGGASPKGGLGSGLGPIGGGTSPKGGVGSGYGPVGGAASPKGGPSAGGVTAALEQVAARVMGVAESPKAMGSFGSDGAGAAGAVQEKQPQEQEAAAPIRPQASGAVALLTPAGTGSFNAHNFPNEL